MDSQKKPLINKIYLIEKFPGRGGWTYVLLPEIPPARRFPFGWLRVYGSVDDVTLEKYKLMPLGNGQLFLPLNASLRKQLKKEAGHSVKIILYEEELSEEIPKVLLDCLKEAPTALRRFEQLTAWEQRLNIDRITDAKNPDRQVDLIVDLIDRLEQGKRI